MEQSLTISSALEDYLEAILTLEQTKGAARVRDIADAVSVHKSTVTAALKALSDKGLLNYSPYELATLTPAGRAMAEGITQNHAAIRRFLRDVLLLEDGVAERNACRMEHVMEPDVLERMKLYARLVRDQREQGDRRVKELDDLMGGNAGGGKRKKKRIATRSATKRPGGDSCRT